MAMNASRAQSSKNGFQLNNKQTILGGADVPWTELSGQTIEAASIYLRDNGEVYFNIAGANAGATDWVNLVDSSGNVLVDGLDSTRFLKGVYESPTLDTGDALGFDAAETSSIFDISGNLRTITVNTTGNGAGICNLPKSTGKWYFEVSFSGVPSANVLSRIGVGSSSHDTSRVLGGSTSANHSAAYCGNGTTSDNGTSKTAGNPPTFGNADRVSVAYDADTRKIWYAKNNVWINNESSQAGDPANNSNHRTTLPGTQIMRPGAGVGAGTNDTATLHANATDCLYTPPTGFDYWTEETDISYQVVAADNGKYLRVNSTSLVKLYLPKDADDNLVIGYTVAVHCANSGGISYMHPDETTTSVLSVNGTLTQTSVDSIGFATKIAANTWVVYGSGIDRSEIVLAGNSGRVRGVNQTTNNDDAASKEYVDTAIGTVDEPPSLWNAGVAQVTALSGGLEIGTANQLDIFNDGLYADALTSDFSIDGAGVSYIYADDSFITLYANNGGAITVGYNGDGYDLAFGRVSITATNSEHLTRGWVHGLNFKWQSEDAVGTLRDMLNADPDTGVELYTAGTKRLQTTTTGVDVTGVISASAGSVTAPGYTFGTDTNCGIYQNANDEIRFATSGVERVSMTSTAFTVGTGFQVNSLFQTMGKFNSPVADPVFYWQNSAVDHTFLQFYEGGNTRLHTLTHSGEFYIECEDAAGVTIEGLRIDPDAKTTVRGDTGLDLVATTGDVTVTGGSVVLSGTGRIQGVDTVSASTDAANKQYVDDAVPNGNVIHTFVVWGTASNTIGDSLNVSSITDNGQADWTINFTSNIASTDYGWAGSGGNDSAAASQTPYLTGKRNVVLANWKTTSSLRVEGVYSNITNDSNTNLGYFSVAIYGG